MPSPKRWRRRAAICIWRRATRRASKALAERLTKEHGVKVAVYRRDLSLTPDVESLGKACQDVDILVNNAGDIPTGTLETIDTATWRKAWDLKVFGYVDLTRIIYPRMCARSSGVIVNIVGAAFKRPNHALHRGLHGQYRARHVHAVPRRREHALWRARGRRPSRPDHVRTGTWLTSRNARKRELGDENRWQELHAKMPGGRAATVKEVAETVAFLASDRSSFTSGGSVIIDGGLMAGTLR